MRWATFLSVFSRSSWSSRNLEILTLDTRRSSRPTPSAKPLMRRTRLRCRSCRRACTGASAWPSPCGVHLRCQLRLHTGLIVLTTQNVLPPHCPTTAIQSTVILNLHMTRHSQRVVDFLHEGPAKSRALIECEAQSGEIRPRVLPVGVVKSQHVVDVLASGIDGGIDGRRFDF